MAGENNSCPYNLDDYFNSLAISHTALFNLSIPCRYSDNDNGIYSLDAPSTFIVQVLRLSVAICIIIAILALYNSIEVLGEIVYSIASFSIHWVVYLLLIMLKCIVLLILLPVIHNANNINHKHTLDYVGFIVTTLIQLLTILMLYIALEHERRFRSPDFASVASLFSRHIPSKTKRQLFFNWPRGFAVFFVCVSLLILIVLVSYPKELVFDEKVSNSCNVTSHNDAAFGPLTWVWLLSMFKVRMCVFSMGICLLFVRRENFKLTVAAKVYLILGMLFSIFEDIPNSIVTVIAFKTYDLDDDHHVCVGKVFTVYDIMQIFGILSLISFFLFIRSQYLRVEQESKLSLIGDMQRLLQVNGRRDVKAL